MTNNQPKKKESNILPLVIIGAVLAASVAGIWYLYSSSKPATPVASNTSRNVSTSTPQQAPVISALGAQPANVQGSESAKVTIEEFADFQCGSCAATHPVLKEIAQTYGSRVKFIFRNFPLSIPAHDKSYAAAVAAEAAGLQGKFWLMQDLLFTNQQSWTSDPEYQKTWLGYAEKIGLDIEKFKGDMASRVAKDRVDLDLQRGRGLGVNSTPTIYVNGFSVPFAQANAAGLKQVIDAELAKATTSEKPANAESNTNSEAGKK